MPEVKQHIGRGLLVTTLNGNNYAHGVFDDLLSIIHGLMELMALTLWPHSQAQQSLSISSKHQHEVFHGYLHKEWHIILISQELLLPQIREIYQLVFPKPKIYQPKGMILTLVNKLIVGTGGKCLHHEHCP
jgi:hypothetical protein